MLSTLDRPVCWFLLEKLNCTLRVAFDFRWWFLSIFRRRTHSLLFNSWTVTLPLPANDWRCWLSSSSHVPRCYSTWHFCARVPGTPSKATGRLMLDTLRRQLAGNIFKIGERNVRMSGCQDSRGRALSPLNERERQNHGSLLKDRVHVLLGSELFFHVTPLLMRIHHIFWLVATRWSNYTLETIDLWTFNKSPKMKC